MDRDEEEGGYAEKRQIMKNMMNGLMTVKGVCKKAQHCPSIALIMKIMMNR